MTTKVTADWADGMAFDIDVGSHRVTVDAAGEFGGGDRGPRPKPLILAALAGCTGMDVVSLLRKMRAEFDSLSIEVEADTADDHPRIYPVIRVRYIFRGARLERDKLEKAVELSQNKYCGVSAMLKLAADLTYEIVEKPA
jgi:putative redox protein